MSGGLKITAAVPNAFSEDKRASFHDVVQQAGEVGGNSLAMNIKEARVLVLGRMEGGIYGVAALKRPQTIYRERITKSAKVEISQLSYPYELGYIYLLPEAQGMKLSHCLVAAALSHAENASVFATIRTDNTAMLATLAKAGFKQTGQDYRGRERRTIRLLVRP